jgi:peptide/nickel transport system substrate-binding protein
MKKLPIAKKTVCYSLIIIVTVCVVIIINALQLITLTHKLPVSQIVVSFPDEPKTFNPVLISEVPNILEFTFEGLTEENSQGQTEPNLAQSWQISQDNKRFIFNLRPGLKWSDGKPLTADDVIFTYNEVFFNPDIPNYAAEYLRIGKNQLFPTLKKIDTLTVEFTLPEPFFPFVRMTSLPILPAHILRKEVYTKNQDGSPKLLFIWGMDTPPEKIIVNGPYTIESYSPSERIVFRKNPYYWRKDLNGKPLPYTERFIWQTISNSDTTLIQFRSGILDHIKVNADYFSLLKRQEKQGKFTIYNGGTSAEIMLMSFNLNKGSRNGQPLVDPIKSKWFNTVEFRQAIAYAINRQSMINNTYQGVGELQNFPLIKQSPYYLSAQQSARVYEYNPKKARELLLQAGFKYNNDNRLLDSQGNTVRFNLLTTAGNKIWEALGSQIKDNLDNIGIQVDFTPIANNALFEKLLNSLEWEAVLLGITFGFEPNDLISIWIPDGKLHFFNQKPSPGQTPISGREVTDWEENIGKLHIAATGEFNEDKRKTIYAQAQQITQEYLPFICLANSLSMVAVRNHITGVNYSVVWGSFWNIYDWKITNNDISLWHHDHQKVNWQIQEANHT